MNVSTMILITTSNTWNSSSEVCSGRTISGLHIGPSACELKNSQWIFSFCWMFHEKEKQSQQKRQFFVPAGCKAYQWVQYSQTLYRFIPHLVPKWKIKEKKLAHQRPSYTTQTVSNIPIFPRFDRYPTPSTHFPALFSSINVFPPKIPPSFF